jgi:hypothetical protein
MMKTRNLILIAAVLVWGCDVQALEDAVDEIDVVVQLDPINTVFSLTVIDAGSLDPIRGATVTFSGGAAGSLIDAYSDPLSNLNLASGAITFGVNNAVVPAESSPVNFRVDASADGYFSSFEQVFATSDGTHSVTLRLQKDNPTQQIAGTAVASGSVSTDQTGATTQAIVVQTPPPPPPPATAQPTQAAQAQATVTVAAGTVPLAAGGQPLQGAITTNIRVYDTAAGLTALPAAARTRSDGSNQIVSGATLFKMSDGSNQVAVTFRAATSGKSAAACGAEFSVTLVDPTTVALASLIPASAYAISAFTPADGNTVVLGVTPAVTTVGSTLVITVCLDGISGIGDASQGIILLVTIGGVTFEVGTLNAQLTIDNPNAFAVNVGGSVLGFGVSLATNFLAQPGSNTNSLATWFGDSSQYPFVSGAASGTAFGLLDDSQTSSAAIANLLTGSATLTLPTVGLQAYSITATAACPAGQVFEVRPTDTSLDALVVKYRPASGGLWNNIPSPIYNVQDASITATGTLSLLPSTAYVFQGQFADESPATVSVTTPGLGTTSFSISINPADYNFDCKTP